MSDIGSQYPVSLNVRENKEMKLKWVQTAKQERISKLAHLRQSIEDLLKGRIPEVERQILHATQELQQLEAHEKLIQTSVDADEIQ